MAALATLEEEEEIKDTDAAVESAATLEEDAGAAYSDTSATTMAAVVRLPGFTAVNDGAANVPSTAVAAVCDTGGDGGDGGDGGGGGGVVLHFVVVVVVVVVEEEEEDVEDKECSCAFS